MIEALFFYVFAFVLVSSAVMVISARSPVHSVLFLILAFFNAAGLFVMLGAEFLAMIMVIVYVGAVAVLFLFVVMMLDINFAELRKGMMAHAPVGVIVGSCLLAEFIWLYWSWTPEAAAGSRAAHAVPGGMTNTHALGQLLYTHYVYLFQISGLILLVAMIGAITLTHRARKGVRRQDVSRQVSRSPKDVVRIEKITTGEGVS